MNRRENEADARIVIDELLAQSGWDADDQSMVGTEVQAASAPGRAGIVDRVGARPFETHAPVYGLVAAAGKFSPDQTVGTEHDGIGWMAIPGWIRAAYNSPSFHLNQERGRATHAIFNGCT